jgi:DtxR family transcriptional regulator, Mn-dependent transcriptional regulator
MTLRSMLSPAVEDYLKAIYKLEIEHPTEEGASTSAIARSMKVSAASVTNMLKRLAEMKLVNYASYKGVTLTDAGKKVALEIIRHHRLLELYLHEVMGYSWDKVHEEAEYLEHHISEEFEDKIAAMLGDPTHDPHGHPIPTKEGHIPALMLTTLADAEAGQSVVIRRVSDADPEMLKYMAEMKLRPNAEVTVVNKEPFNGPITLEIDGERRSLGAEVARHISVSILA